MKKFLLILFLCGTVAGATFAQEGRRTNSFVVFLHGGYGMMPGKTSGLTNSSPDYIKKLSSGGIWNAQMYFRHKMFIVGLLYSGYTAKNSWERPYENSFDTGSDKLLTTYIGPQIGVSIPIKSFDIDINGGCGGIWYRNYSVMLENNRKVKGGSVGVNLGLKGVYNFSKHFGVSLEVAGILANLNHTNNTQNDKTVRVNYSEPPLRLNQLTFSLGLKYSL